MARIKEESQVGLLEDSRCNRALTVLNDELCTYERQTGREYTLILIPHSIDELWIVTANGKPMADCGPTPQEALDFALRVRDAAHKAFVQGIVG